LNGEYKSVIWFAASCGNVEIFELLLQEGAFLESGLLLQAASYGHISIMKILIARNISVHEEDSDGYSCIAAAAFGGYTSCVQYLLEKGADPNSQDSNGVSSLHFATGGGHIDVVLLLLKSGADVTLLDSDGMSILMYALRGSRLEIVNILMTFIKQNLPLEAILPHLERARHDDGINGLMIAADEGFSEGIEILLEAGVSITTKDFCGKSAIFYALPHAPTLQLLCRHLRQSVTTDSDYFTHSAMINLKNDNDNEKHILIAACHKKELFDSLVIILQEAKNEEDESSNSRYDMIGVNGKAAICFLKALQFAVAKGRKDLMKLLVEADVDIGLDISVMIEMAKQLSLENKRKRVCLIASFEQVWNIVIKYLKEESNIKK
jgi:ankyrin repeat protein